MTMLLGKVPLVVYWWLWLSAGVTIASVSSVTSATTITTENTMAKAAAVVQGEQQQATFLRRNLQSNTSSTTNSTTDQQQQQQQQGIVGGGKAEPGKYEFFVEVLAQSTVSNNNPQFVRRCGGVMISGDLVLTLASCVLTDRLGNPAVLDLSRAIIKRNEVEINEGIVRQWKEIRIHPNYVVGQDDNNVAVIFLNENPLVPQKDINDINSNVTAPPIDATATAVGYGVTNNAGSLTYSHELREAEVTILSGINPPCDIANNETLLCVDTNPKKKSHVDFCLGDEGAPLMRTDRKLYGLYVRGGTCNSGTPSTTPAVFIRMSFHRDWVWSTACALTNARCAASCFGFTAITNFAGRVRDTVDSVLEVLGVHDLLLP